MFLILFFILMGLILMFLLKCYFWRHKYSQLMPGTRPGVFDFLADGRKILFFKRKNSRYFYLIRFMEELRKFYKIYQKENLFCIWFSYTPLVFLVKADSVKEALKGNTMKEKSWVYEFMKPLFGYGLVTCPHAIWKPRRKILNRCFHPEILRGFLPIFNENAQKLVQFFRRSESEITEISHPIALCTLDIICEFVFDVKLENLVNNGSQYAKSVLICSEFVMNRMGKFWQWPDIIAWNLPAGREAKFHFNVLKEFTEKVIREKKRRCISLDTKAEKGKRKALIDILLQLQLADHDLTEKDVKENIDTFAAAGQDTVAVTTYWALYLIGLDTDIQARIHQELDRIFGEDNDKEITEDDLNQLQYLDCVIKETLRLYPPAPLFGRQAEEDTSICGHTIPKGAACFVLTYFLHRDEDVFPDPEKFDPDRFLPENYKTIPEFAYVPFSGGPRNCIGNRFAIMEVKILVATVLRSYSIESLEERDKVKPVMQISLQSSTPVYVKFRTRTKKTN